MNFKSKLMGAVAGTAMLMGASAASALDEITVAYFLEWPTPNQFAQADGSFSEMMGVKVNWTAFDTGAQMSAAMAAGNIHIAYSHGLVPFIAAVSNGVKIKTVGIAVSYAENDNCVVHGKSGITKGSAAGLEGKRVAVPLGTVPHYKLLRQLDYLNVNTEKVKLVDMSPQDGVTALARGAVAMACGWGGSLVRMKKYGDVLMSASELEAMGVQVFDVISVTNDFADKYPKLVTKFLRVTDQAAAYLREDPGKAQPVIAKAAGMKLADSNKVLGRFVFLSKKDQLTAGWLGGGTQALMKEVADFMVEAKQMAKAMDNYNRVVDASFYQNVR